VSYRRGDEQDYYRKLDGQHNTYYARIQLNMSEPEQRYNDPDRGSPYPPGATNYSSYRRPEQTIERDLDGVICDQCDARSSESARAAEPPSYEGIESPRVLHVAAHCNEPDAYQE